MPRVVPVVLLALSLNACATSRPMTPIKVACVGEQTTHSAHRENDPEFPERLAALLGKGFQVMNFGLPKGRVLSDAPAADAEAYAASEAFTQSKAYQPQAVVFGPWGVHDTYAGNWPEHRAEFAGDLAALVGAYTGLPSKPVVFLVTPLPYDARAEHAIAELLTPTRELAHALALPSIDLWSAFLGHPEWYKDPTHLTPEGQQQHAQVVAQSLRERFDR
jgi:GDSL-like lipase/acylhydrolase family protein